MVRIDTFSDEGLGLYVHVPFCINKCSYCDFYSLPIASHNLIEQYVESLITEIRLKAEQLDNKAIETVYLGGGTPSLLSARQFSLILETIAKYYQLNNDAEISLEANPATLEASQLKSYLAAGLNRLSLGCQSFIDSHLELLGRMHDVEQIYKTVDLINQVGLENYNLDLIYGLPNQTMEQWLFNLEKAAALDPKHISLYLLQLEPSTPLGSQVINEEIFLLDEEIEANMYNETLDYLTARGFEQYEISNFSRSGYRCKHNLIYWQAKRYLGIGAGAVSFIDDKRCINKPQVVEYINYLAKGQMPPLEIQEIMNEKQLREDAIILQLRLTEGIDIAKFNAIYKTDLLNEFELPIKDSIAKKLLKIEKGHLFLTKPSYFLSNQVLCHFIGN